MTRTGDQAVFAPAPDPGRRLSSRAVWDESARPAGPPAPEGHAYSGRAQAVGAHLVDVHDHLRSELTQIRNLLQQVRRGSVSAGDARSVLNQMTMRQNNWTLGAYCASYCTMLTQHHQMEDAAIFPHLRRADAALAPVVDRLAEEHLIIHEVVEGVDRALVGLVSDPGDFTDLQDAVDVLTDALLSHLAREAARADLPAVIALIADDVLAKARDFAVVDDDYERAFASIAARERGCALVQLTSDKARAEAHRFYARIGFVPSHVGMKLTL